MKIKKIITTNLIKYEINFIIGRGKSGIIFNIIVFVITK